MIKTINPGQFNKRIKIMLQPKDLNTDVELGDAGGGVLDRFDESLGWTQVCTVWASIRPASEKASMIAAQLAETISHTVLIRYRADVKVSHVINFNGRRLDIRTLRNFDEAKQYLQLMCEEIGYED